MNEGFPGSPSETQVTPPVETENQKLKRQHKERTLPEGDPRPEVKSYIDLMLGGEFNTTVDMNALPPDNEALQIEAAQFIIGHRTYYDSPLTSDYIMSKDKTGFFLRLNTFVENAKRRQEKNAISARAKQAYEDGTNK